MSNAQRYRVRKSVAAGFLLAGCLMSASAFSQEIIKWVDEDGVTHFGHAATAARQAMQAQMDNKASEPAAASPPAEGTGDRVESALSTTALAVNTTPTTSAAGSE